MATEEPELKLYKYNVYGNEVEGQLTAEHAERIGAAPLDDASGATDADAASTTGTSTGATTKARTPSKNK